MGRYIVVIFEASVTNCKIMNVDEFNIYDPCDPKTIDVYSSSIQSKRLKGE